MWAGACLNLTITLRFTEICADSCIIARMIIEPLNDNHRFERLVQKLAPTSKLLRVWALKGGISAEMTAIEIETPDG